MYTNSVSQYLALIKKHGLAVNNLYMVEISLPTALAAKSRLIRTNYETQIDTDKRINNSNMFSGIVNVDKYKKGMENIGSTLGLGGDKNTGYTDKRAFMYDSTEKVCILCVAAELPFYKQKVNNAFYNHMTHKMATGIDTDAITLSFYVDRDNAVVEMFSGWQDLINNTDKAKDGREGMMSYKNEYAANEMNISLINKQHGNNPNQAKLEKFHSAKLVGAFPSHIQPLRINNGTTELLQLNVTIEYDKIRHESMQLQGEDPTLTQNVTTGLNLLDMKNRLGDAVSEGKNMINNVRSDMKSASNIANDTVRNVRNIFE